MKQKTNQEQNKKITNEIAVHAYLKKHKLVN